MLCSYKQNKKKKHNCKKILKNCYFNKYICLILTDYIGWRPINVFVNQHKYIEDHLANI